MTSARIADLLSPFLSPAELDDVQLDQISSYLELLLRWNVRMNLTAIHTPEHIATRHFGESLFAARCLFPGNPSTTSSESHDQTHQDNPHAGAPSLSRSMRQGGAVPSSTSEPAPHLIDVGSGAGFPGLPIKIWTPNLRVTLIESNQKKATFLREVARTLTLTNVNVFAGRAENYLSASANPNPAPSQPASLNGSADPRADAVTLRAVERFADILPTAATLVRPGGRLCLLISQEQSALAISLLPSISWHHPAPLPLSETRIVLIGTLPPHEPK